METKLVRIAEISAKSKHPIFTSVYHLINEEMLKQCHKELDGSKAVGVDKVTKDEYGKNLDRNIKDSVQRLKNKSFKPLPSLRVYITKAKGKYDCAFVDNEMPYGRVSQGHPVIVDYFYHEEIRGTENTGKRNR